MTTFKQYRAITSLCLLYYLQGIPYGIQVKSLPIYYYDVLHFPINFVTKISLLMSPWIFLKPFIAPFIKSSKVTSCFIYVGLFFNVLLNSCMYITINEGSLTLTMCLLFLINCSTVFIDVATDHLAISSATSLSDLKFLGITNAIQIVAYKCGAMFSGFAILLLGYDKINNMFLLLSGIYCIAFGVLYILLPKQKTHESVDTKTSFGSGWISNILQVFSVPSTLPLLFYVLLYKLGEIGASTMFPLFLIQSGFNRDDVSMLSSLISEPISLIGSLAGGLVWAIFKPTAPINMLIKLLAIIGVSRIIPLCLEVFTLAPNFIPETYWYYIVAASVGILSFLGGIVSTLTFTLMMVIACQAPEDVQASHYAMLSSIEVTGKLLFSSYVGTCSQYFSEINIYFGFCVVTLLGSCTLYFVHLGKEKKQE